MLQRVWGWPERYGLRLFSVLLAFSVFFSATGVTWAHVGPELGKAVARAFYTDLPEFSEAPGPIEYGSNPSRGEGYRNGLWTEDDQAALDEMSALENGNELFPEASTFDPFENMGVHDEPSPEEVPADAPAGVFAASSGTRDTTSTTTIRQRRRMWLSLTTRCSARLPWSMALEPQAGATTPRSG